MFASLFCKKKPSKPRVTALSLTHPATQPIPCLSSTLLRMFQYGAMMGVTPGSPEDIAYMKLAEGKPIVYRDDVTQGLVIGIMTQFGIIQFASEMAGLTRQYTVSGPPELSLLHPHLYTESQTDVWVQQQLGYQGNKQSIQRISTDTLTELREPLLKRFHAEPVGKDQLDEISPPGTPKELLAALYTKVGGSGKEKGVNK